LGAAEAILSNPNLNRQEQMAISTLALNIAFARQEYETALNLARFQVELDPQDPAFRLNLAQALFLTGDQAGAAAQLQEAERLDVNQQLAQARQFISQAMAQGAQPRPRSAAAP
jgi:predicted Zn-dependent protease